MGGQFLGRTAELNALQESFDKNCFQMVVIYGRRRIGKTALVNRFVKKNKCKYISFVATERNESELLRRMGDCVLQGLSPNLLGKMSFDSFEAVFDYIADAAKSEKIVFVIDEYPYLAKECPYISSVLQKYIDHDWKNTALFFVMLGSFVSFMEEEVLSKNAPLHGRSDLQFKLRPFDYYESALFVPKFTKEEKAIVYGVTGGVAKHLAQFDDKKSLDENIKKLFFSQTAFFSEEQIKTIVSSDKTSPTAYNSIIEAIAGGKTKYNEIETTAGMKDISFCLKNLIAGEIVERRTSPKPYYIISDSLISFYFNYVSKGDSLINAGKGESYYTQKVRGRLHEHMGKVFEEMARQYIFRNLGTKKIPAFVTELTEYQASKKIKGEIKSIEIDLLGLDGKDYVLAAECKFKTEKFGKDDLEAFLEKLNYIPARNLKLMIFSLSGFSDYVLKRKSEFTLVTLGDMY